MQLRLLLLALILCCGAGCVGNSNMRASSGDAEISYIPLGISTYTAVTVDNIGTEGSCLMKDKAEGFQWLIDLQGADTGNAFDKNNVRAKIVIGNRAIYIDNHGVVLAPNGQAALSDDAKARLVGMLEGLRKASSCDRYDWLDD